MRLYISAWQAMRAVPNTTIFLILVCVDIGITRPRIGILMELHRQGGQDIYVGVFIYMMAGTGFSKQFDPNMENLFIIIFKSALFHIEIESPNKTLRVTKYVNKLGLSSAKLRAQLASPARSIHLSPSLYF